MKDFKRCPRCNAKTPIDFGRCGNCGLNYIKFETATNNEAKSALRMNEKERVIQTKRVPNDIKKVEMILMCIFGGWFGLHLFKVGKFWSGIVQIIGSILSLVYTYFFVMRQINNGYLGYLLLICGIIWAYSFIRWIIDIFSIIFNKFKYPVSLPYASAEKGE